ncbi:hypothetical protein KIN20_015629 [Parelaphostrongylus tenuis]|uniref:Uncharacterized protein n=1 Tax=Parelaphostrongylus tenuis TaxID=148309 RepID=A0AAD5N0V9_PARTN|nr:hypothetical protein KIN20_015629 [Parelaphostrongylus tenuis]
MSSLTRSPSLEAMYRRRPSFTRPPIRAINSPRLTEEEADQLTSLFLWIFVYHSIRLPLKTTRLVTRTHSDTSKRSRYCS